MALTDKAIAHAKPTQKGFRLADGGSLFLEVTPSGVKLWRYRYRVGGRQNILALGRYYDAARKPADHVTLEAARVARDEARKLVKQGINPARHRQAELLKNRTANANTFEQIAGEWIEKNKLHWSKNYLHQVERFLDVDVFPHIGKLPIRTVTAAHLLEILQRVEKRGALTIALLLRQWSSAIFRHAVVTLRADSDPAAALKGAIRRKRVEHKKPLSRDQIRSLVTGIDESAYRTTAIAMRLLLLTFVRPGELRGAEWDEFDLNQQIWRIPASRMKMREVHIVPLANQAITLLKELYTITGKSRFLFPNQRQPDTVMTITTLNRVIERMGFGGHFSAHSFRATASTFLNEMGYRSDVIERQLAHKERNKVRASYNQAEYLTERKQMMQTWANYIDTVVAGHGNVLPINTNSVRVQD